jgi:hypothetical protein
MEEKVYTFFGSLDNLIDRHCRFKDDEASRFFIVDYDVMEDGDTGRVFVGVSMVCIIGQNKYTNAQMYSFENDSMVDLNELILLDDI